RTAVLVFLLLFFYLATAWQQWHYGGLSGRAMVQSYPLWAFPFGVLMETMMRRKWSAWLLALLLLLFIYQNLWWTYFAHRPGILVSGASKTYYWKTLGRWHTDEEDLKWLDNKHVFRGTPTDSVLIYYNDFSNDTSKNCLRVGDQVFIRVNRQMPKTAAYAVPRPQAVHEWIRARADFSAASKEWDVWKQSQFIVQFVYNSDTVQTNFIRVDRFLNEGQWRTLHLDARVPDKPWNRLLVLIRNFGSDKEVQIDNLEVIMFSP
ncbi:MAG: hypothetical protein NZM08_08760, partial [Chitinophagales bacterium]|nr:hypothetical protein [Chitinophagales bacterium]